MTNHIHHSSPSSSNASATQSSSTTSKQPSTVYAATGSASKQTARFSSPLRQDARRPEMAGQLMILKLRRELSFRRMSRGVIRLLRCRGFCIGRMYDDLFDVDFLFL